MIAVNWSMARGWVFSGRMLLCKTGGIIARRCAVGHAQGRRRLAVSGLQPGGVAPGRLNTRTPPITPRMSSAMPALSASVGQRPYQMKA